MFIDLIFAGHVFPSSTFHTDLSKSEAKMLFKTQTEKVRGISQKQTLQNHKLILICQMKST